MVGPVIVNEGKVVRPSQLIASVRRTGQREGMGRILSCVALWLATIGCATTHYVRRPEAERSGHIFAGAIRAGMTLQDVVRSMAESRLPGQYASLSSDAPSGDTVRIILHAGEPLGSVGHMRIFAAGYGSIEVYHRVERRSGSQGFERQGTFLTAVGVRQQELLAYPRYVAAFDATVEGGCGQSTVALVFDATGRVSEVGQLEESACGS